MGAFKNLITERTVEEIQAMIKDNSERIPDPGHKEENCPRVAIRMGCYACGYPESESMFPAPDFEDSLTPAYWKTLWRDSKRRLEKTEKILKEIRGNSNPSYLKDKVDKYFKEENNA